MSKCNIFNPDNVFKRFKVIEFPTSYVGLSTTQILNVDVDLSRSAYLKTMCEGNLMSFDDARLISASHRAYHINIKDKYTVEVTFLPGNESVFKAKRNNELDKRFVFDLRLIQVDEVRCCHQELHAEIGRFYISGQYEYCQVSHCPKILDFGDVAINRKVTKYIRVRNDSSLIAAKIWLDRVTCFQFSPNKFTLAPNSSIRLSISIRPTGLKVAKTFSLNIRNPHDLLFETQDGTAPEDENYITYVIAHKINISYDKIPKEPVIVSLHKLTDQLPCYTYLNEEVEIQKDRKSQGKTYLAHGKMVAKKIEKVKFSTGRDTCCSDILNKIQKLDKNFCKTKKAKITTYDLFDVLMFPYSVDFGKVAISTNGKSVLTIKNKSKYDITITMVYENFISYTENMLPEISIKLKSLQKTKLVVFCQGRVQGPHKGTFNYIIDDIYRGKHSYSMEVRNPLLMVQEKCLKFGMVTSDCFITSVPVRIHNYYNIPVHFEWDELLSDTPFEIMPISGSIPSHSCKICNVMYITNASKTKVHEINLISKSNKPSSIPLELSVITRKLSIKFLQQAVLIKDIPLNLETVEKVKLENSSREIAFFHVVEPLIPGLTMEPLSGTIRPKMIMTFDIIIKISYVMEFAFDICVKINNKENVILPISGNVVEPKVLIYPKNIYMSRTPSFMVSYVPVTFQNLGPGKCEVTVIDTDDENIFDVFIAIGNEKQKVDKFRIEAEHSKTVFVKVYDEFRREYEMYIPFRINGILGPPNGNALSTELQYYIGEYEQYYENNTRVKLRNVNKDISYCRITGVITVSWIDFSVEKFEFDYLPGEPNTLEFQMTNVSKYYLHVTIIISKLSPHFTLELLTGEEANQTIVRTETSIKIELDRAMQADFSLKFHPKGHGKFVTTAIMFLDKQMTIPYSNLTFIGKRESPPMTPSTYRIIFPPCHIGTEVGRTITIDMEAEAQLNTFNCFFKENLNLTVQFVDHKIIEKDEAIHTIVTVKLTILTAAPCTGIAMLHFNHESGSSCDVEVKFCVTYCLITLHANHLVDPEDHPYPYYPLVNQSELHKYMEQCSLFLEIWMFQQGFRRDLYPVIPDTFHALSSTLSTQSGTKTKGINVTYLNFVRRIAGPLMKHIRKVEVHELNDTFKFVKEIHDTYREILNLLKARGANVLVIQAKYLLSYDQFAIYSENVTPKCNADIVETQNLLSDANLFKRLNKQSWIDFILQSYKVFVMDSCFFECVCISNQPRDIIKVLTDWFNEHIRKQHDKLLGKNKPVKEITNITTDLTDGIALASAFMTYCPFLMDHFSLFCEIHEESREGDVINNACLIIEAMNQLRIFFPLSAIQFFEPNYLQMLFLSIHLYVVLPMFDRKATIEFHPPLLRGSSRLVAICPTSQESLIFSHFILNSTRSNFFVEKAPAADNVKKMFLNVKYTANFVTHESCILLIHGYNKTRIFDTYIVFLLRGQVGVLNPLRKCKVTGPLYRPNKVDVQVASPFLTPCTFQVYITDVEPSIPVIFEETPKSRFFISRLNLIDKEISLMGMPKDAKEQQQDIPDHKLYLQMICLSTQVGNTWIWFRSEIGQFFIRVTTQPRWDLPIESLQAKLRSWPADPCSCGESCECYRTTVLMIPHQNDLMIKALRYALFEHASSTMMEIFDKLIVKGPLSSVIVHTFELPIFRRCCKRHDRGLTGEVMNNHRRYPEGGTTMTEVNHILRDTISYKITSRALVPRIDRVKFYHHTDAIFPLPITIPTTQKFEKYSVTFSSDCGMDIRNYRIFFIQMTATAESSSEKSVTS